MQTPHTPRKWERGNINLSADHVHDPAGGQDILSVFLLGRIQTIFDQTVDPAGGRSLMQAVRFLEIGGAVLTYSAFMTDLGGFQQPFLGDRCILQARALLCSDRTDVAQLPAAATPNWFTNTQPVVGIAEVQDEQSNYPTQIHHQENWEFINTGYIGPNVSGNLPFQVAVERSSRSTSQRLRLRLDDDQCLVLHFASHLPAIADESRNMAVHFHITGTIYYRYVFGSR